MEIGALVTPSKPKHPDASLIQSAVIQQRDGFTMVRAYLGRSILSPVCELTLPTRQFAIITRQSWIQVKDVISHTIYRVKVSSVAFEGRRLPVFFYSGNSSRANRLNTYVVTFQEYQATWRSMSYG
jgi:hypothetical protein